MKRLIPIMTVILIAAFALSACAQTPVPADPKPVEPESMYPGTSEAAPVDVEALVIEKLAGEHTLEFVLQEKRTAEEWSEVLDRMIGYGAEINEEEKALIIEWLLEQ